LLSCAAIGIERRRAFEVRGGVLEPYQAAIVQMGEDCGDRAATSLFTGRIRAPGPRIEIREQELVHGVVDGIGFEEDVANFGKCAIGL